MSAVLNNQFVSAFEKNEVYKIASKKYGGNACDLVFNHFTISRIQSSEQRRDTTIKYKKNIGGVFLSEMKFRLVKGSQRQATYREMDDFAIRDELCRCFFSDFTVACVDKIS